MFYLIKNKVLIGVILYLIPFSSSFLIFRSFSWLIEPSNSIENAIYAYSIYIVLIIISFIGSFLVARSGRSRSWWIKFFFSMVAIAQFLPVLILAVIGALSIFIHDQFKIKYSKFGCTVTAMLSAMGAFSLMLFVVEKGNIKTARNIKKAVLVVHHLGSGDYFIAALLALFHNWRVMIGANLWKYKIFHWFFNAVGIPIERENNANKKKFEAVQISKNFLISNRQSRLIVFAKGTRERDPKKGVYGLQTGGIKIAHELGIPIIPVTIIDTDKWRSPWTQDITSQKGRKQNPFRLFTSYVYQFFKTGINPTIAKVVYGNPIAMSDKTVQEIKNEVETTMHQTYMAYTVGKKRKRNSRH